jgi:hypothetical protein
MLNTYTYVSTMYLPIQVPQNCLPREKKGIFGVFIMLILRYLKKNGQFCFIHVDSHCSIPRHINSIKVNLTISLL